MVERIGCSDALHRTSSPWENGYVESFSGNSLDELLNREFFHMLEEAQGLIESRRREYDQVRPYTALGYSFPAPEAVRASALVAPLMGRQEVNYHKN